LLNKIKIQLNILEKVLFGSVTWNYFFIVPSILLGLSSNLITKYFMAFTLISIGVIIATFIITLSTNAGKLKIQKKNILSQSTNAYIIGLSCLLFFSFLVLLFHNIFVEWDVIYCYIPAAKAINLSGNIMENPYRKLNFFDASPAIPIVYALLLPYSGIDSLYLVPLIYFTLTLIAVFLISKKIFSQDYSLISTLIFISLPTVTMVLSSRALYLDIAFLFYLLVTVYTAMNLFQEDFQTKLFQFNSLTFIFSFSLLFFTKVEFGILLITVAVAIWILIIKCKYWKIISAIFLGAPYCLRETISIMMGNALWSLCIQRLLPIILIALLVFVILKLFYKEDFNTKKLNGPLLLLCLTFSPAIYYLIRNIAISGFLYPGLPLTNIEIMKSLNFYNKIEPSPERSLVEVMQWHNIISVWWSVEIYLMPFLIGVVSLIYSTLKNKNVTPQKIPLLYIFFGLFLIWSQLGCDPQPRRLYPFAPFIALIITFGFHAISKKYNSKIFSLRIITYIIAVISITWIMNGIKSVNDLAVFYHTLHRSPIKVEYATVSNIFFLIITVPYEFIIARIIQKINFLKSKKIATIAFFIFVLINFIIFSFLMTPIVSDVMNNGCTLRYKRFSGWYYYPDVVDYFNKNITDTGVIVGFYCNELITFANRTVIDLYIPIYASPIYSIIERTNVTEVLEVFNRLGIKYFLRPKPNNPFFPIYEKLMNSTILGTILADDSQLYYLATFKYATLYALYENSTIGYEKE